MSRSAFSMPRAGTSILGGLRIVLSSMERPTQSRSSRWGRTVSMMGQTRTMWLHLKNSRLLTDQVDNKHPQPASVRSYQSDRFPLHPTLLLVRSLDEQPLPAVFPHPDLGSFGELEMNGRLSQWGE